MDYYQDCEGGVKYDHKNKTDWSRELERIVQDMLRRIKVNEELSDKHNKLYQEEAEKRKANKANLPIPQYEVMKREKSTCREPKSVAVLRLKINVAKFMVTEKEEYDDENMQELLSMESSCDKGELPREQNFPREQEIIPPREQLEDAMVIEEDSDDKEYKDDADDVDDEVIANQYCAIPDDPNVEKEEDIATKAKMG